MSESVQENKYGFISLAPKEDINDGNEAAYEALKFSLDLKNKNIHNIAISGPFGAGKSSLWRSYKKTLLDETEKDSTIPCKKDILEISLAKFDEEKKETKEFNESNGITVNISNSNLNDLKGEKSNNPQIINANNVGPDQDDKEIEFEIEKTILQQMLFSVENDDIPSLTSFKLSEKRTCVNVFFSLVIPFLFFLVMDFYFEDNLHEFFYDISLGEIQIDMYEVWLVLMIIASLLLIPFVYRLLIKMSNVHVCGFSYNGIDVSFDQTKGSLINQNYAVIVYFFEKTKKKIVAFEDLDRFSSNKIFVKLRELNIILNNCPKLKDKIKFVYMVKDNLFTKYERTKFFDMIVPVLPVVNMESCADFLIKKKNEEKKELNKRFSSNNPQSDELEEFSMVYLDDDLLRIVGRRINDLRVINDCLNEFKIYKAQLRKDLNRIPHLDNKIFAMVVYKNFYPQDFESLHRHKGFLYSICKNYKYRIVENNSETASDDVLLMLSLNDVFRDKGDARRRWINWQCLRLELKQDYDGKDLIWTNERQKPLINEILSAEARRKPSLLFDLLENGYIDTNCEFYVSRKYLGDLELDDYRYFVIVQMNGDPEYSLAVQKPRLLEHMILAYQWSYPSILNKRMFAYQLNTNDKSAKEKDVVIGGMVSAMVDDAEKEENNFFKQFLAFLDDEIKDCSVALDEEKFCVVPRVAGPNTKEKLWDAIYMYMNEKTLSVLFGE